MNGGGPPGGFRPPPELGGGPPGGFNPPPELGRRAPGQRYTGPGLAQGERERGLFGVADELAAQRQAMARDYLARVQAGQSAALAQQQLGAGAMQQQQIAAGVRGPLAQRAAMYGQSRAAGDLIAQQAMARAQEEQVAQALWQQTYGAGAQQQLAQAQQGLQGYGISLQMEVARRQQAAAAEQQEAEFLRGIIGASVGAAGAGAAMSDRRLKTEIRRPRTAAGQELLRALMEVDHA